VEGEVVGRIERGLLALIGVGDGDTSADAAWIARKLAGLRIFEDGDGKMNLAVRDVGGSVLVVSQFTLHGDCRKGRRPSFVKAMEPVGAEALVAEVVTHVGAEGIPVETGRFRAHMDVELVNDGPVTLWLDSVSGA
jgi:D-tyrosyl-tRNA(Tyr) deacylase